MLPLEWGEQDTAVGMKLEFPSPKPKVGPQTCSREGRRPQSRG